MNHGDEKTGWMSAEQNHLRRIEGRINSLKVYNPGSAELARMKAAREDVISRMSADDLEAYKKHMNKAKTPEELQAEAEAERLAMDANKDKPAI